MPRGHRRGFRWTTPEARFWKHVEKTKTCWLWTACCMPFPNHPELQGHGQLRVDGHVVLAHVFSWTLHHGLVPDGLCVLHHCDTRPCVRPDHLFLGTRRDNTQDALRKDRLPWGERASWSKLTTVQVQQIRTTPRILSFSALGQKYGVSEATIRAVVYRRTWKQLPDQ